MPIAVGRGGSAATRVDEIVLIVGVDAVGVVVVVGVVGVVAVCGNARDDDVLLAIGRDAGGDGSKSNSVEGLSFGNSGMLPSSCLIV